MTTGTATSTATEVKKKLINDIQDCVDENLLGIAACNPGVKKLLTARVIIRSDVEKFKSSGKVALISGGGSGHEPMFAGLVGDGCLTACVAGSIFTSPPPAQILAGLEAIDNSTGILVIIINYTGDRLNFGIAIERFKQSSKTPIRSLAVADDCALTSRDRSAGRRGLAATLLVFKICGAMANEGLSLDQICTRADNILRNIGTIGLSLSSCSLPNSAPMFKLGSNEMELGLGIHGEPGVKRIEMQTAKQAVQIMLNHMTDSESPTKFDMGRGDRLAVVLNNLGGLSQLEMGIVAKEVIQNLTDETGAIIKRIYVGTFMTSLEMQGISISILKIVDDAWYFYLDSPVTCSSWPIQASIKYDADYSINLSDCLMQPAPKSDRMEILTEAKPIPNLSTDLGKCLMLVCDCLIQNQEFLNELDRFCGDGDCGSTIKRGSLAVKSALNTNKLSVEDASKFLGQLSQIWENSAGGTAGAIYSLFLSSASQSFVGKSFNDCAAWFEALIDGTKTVIQYGSAKPGDRTMIDPLHAATDFAERNVNRVKCGLDRTTLQDFLQVVNEAALATKDMQAKAGRASYVAKENLTHPDPGAMGVYLWIKSIVDYCMQLYT